MFMHPYDDPDLIAGQETIGLEILEDLQDADMIVVPVGGGGLMAGIAVASKALSPDTKVLGIQATACPSAFEALRAGKPVRVEEKKSIADAIMVPAVGKGDFPILRDLVDGIVLVDEGQIAAAMLLLLERKRILAEGAGATPLAALLDPASKIPKGRKVVLVISGGNADPVLLDRILQQGLTLQGRFMRFSICVEDLPGNLAKILDLLAGLGVNVLNIYHSRAESCLPIFATRIDIELETRGFDHISRITEALRNAGHQIELK
jgi:threonine dehydratase